MKLKHLYLVLAFIGIVGPLLLSHRVSYGSRPRWQSISTAVLWYSDLDLLCRGSDRVERGVRDLRAT
jgi:hypothetical protein